MSIEVPGPKRKAEALPKPSNEGSQEPVPSPEPKPDIRQVLYERSRRWQPELRINNAGEWHHTPGLKILRTDRKPGESPSAERGIDARKAAYEFSKEYSKEYRKRLAAELREIRQKYRVDFPSENKERGQLRDAIDKQLAEDSGRAEETNMQAGQQKGAYEAAAAELSLRHREIEALEQAIERKKNSYVRSFAAAATLRLGFVEESHETRLKRLRHETEALQRDVSVKKHTAESAQSSAENIGLANQGSTSTLLWYRGQLEDLILDQAETDVLKQKIASFYENQLGIKDDWEQTQRLREVAFQSRQHNVLFLHGINLAPAEHMANTADNNPTLNTRALTGIAKAELLLGLEPTISTSTVLLDERARQPNAGGAMYV